MTWFTLPGEWSGEAELLKHARLVPLLPSFQDLAAGDTIHRQTVDDYRLAGRRRRSQRAGVRPGCMPAKRDPVAFDHLILHRETEIGECAQESSHELLPRTDSADWLRNAGYV